MHVSTPWGVSLVHNHAFATLAGILPVRYYIDCAVVVHSRWLKCEINQSMKKVYRLQTVLLRTQAHSSASSPEEFKSSGRLRV